MAQYNEHKFTELARELSGPLLRYLTRYTGDPSIAEDLLQETLVRIARGLSGFDGRSTVKTWAFAIATRTAADYYRNPSHRPMIVEVDEAMQLADSDLPVSDQIVINEMNSCVRQVIDSLPEDYRAALVLHEFEGLTAQQIADVCGCSLPTAKIRMHRARQRLRSALEHQCDFYRDSENTLRCERKC